MDCSIAGPGEELVGSVPSIVGTGNQQEGKFYEPSAGSYTVIVVRGWLLV